MSRTKLQDLYYQNKKKGKIKNFFTAVARKDKFQTSPVRITKVLNQDFNDVPKNYTGLVPRIFKTLKPRVVAHSKQYLNSVIINDFMYNKELNQNGFFDNLAFDIEDYRVTPVNDYFDNDERMFYINFRYEKTDYIFTVAVLIIKARPVVIKPQYCLLINENNDEDYAVLDAIKSINIDKEII